MLSVHDDLNFSRVTNYLVKDLKTLEHKIGKAYKNKSVLNGKKQLCKELEKFYENELQKTRSKLESISFSLFLETNIDLVRVYKAAEEIPENFKFYSNTADNLINLVKLDVSTKNDSHALASIERWIYLVKICHENHDCFSALSIFLGLSRLEQDKPKLFNHLLPMSKVVYDFYKHLYCNLNKIHLFQLQLYPELRAELNEDEVFVPVLMVLGNIQTVGNQAAELDESGESVKNLIKESIEFYSQIQREGKRFKVNSNSYSYIDNSTNTEWCRKVLRKDPSLYNNDSIISAADKKNQETKEKIKGHKKSLHDKEKIKAIKFMGGLYKKEDNYYLLKQKLEDCIDELKVLGTKNKKCMEIIEYLNTKQIPHLSELLKQEKSQGFPNISKNIYVAAVKAMKITKAINKEPYRLKQNQVNPVSYRSSSDLTKEIPVAVKESQNKITEKKVIHEKTPSEDNHALSLEKSETKSETKKERKSERKNKRKNETKNETKSETKSEEGPASLIVINDEKNDKPEKKAENPIPAKRVSPPLSRTKTPIPSPRPYISLSATSIFTPNKYSPRPPEVQKEEEKKEEKRSLKRKFQRPVAGCSLPQTLPVIEESDENNDDVKSSHSVRVSFIFESSQEISESTFSFQESESDLSKSLEIQVHDHRSSKAVEQKEDIAKQKVEQKDEITKRPERSYSTPIRPYFYRNNNTGLGVPPTSPHVNAVVTPRENNKVSELIKRFDSSSEVNQSRLFHTQSQRHSMEIKKERKNEFQEARPFFKPE